jgi:hypothetical protein
MGRVLAGRVRLDTHLRFESLATLADRVGIVRRVSDAAAHVAGPELFQQFFIQWSVVGPASRQAEGDRSTMLSDDGMHFRCQSATRTSQTASKPARCGVLLVQPEA